jgi:superfamily II DNA/RNA helicase
MVAPASSSRRMWPRGGLDLPDLALVIHADLPNDHETLLHRSGRTGRAGKKGLCMAGRVPYNRRRKVERAAGRGASQSHLGDGANGR